MSVVGVLLAAGPGRRYGSPKVLAHQGLWLNTAIDALRSGGCDRVLVVLGAAESPVPEGAEAVRAEQWRDGMGASLRVGLAAATKDPAAQHVAVLLVDIPDVGAEVVARVIAAATSTGLARAWFDDRPGHPVVLGRRHWQPISDEVVGDEGARGYLHRHQDEVVRVPCEDLATGIDHDHR